MTLDSLVRSPRFQAAARTLAETHEAFVADLVALTEIPAPPFREQARAQAMRERFRALGLADVTIDAEGNVTGLRPGTGTGRGLTCVAAHLDTVFPAGTDVTVRREGDILRAPGVGDDTRGLALMLALIRALDAAGIATEADLLFVADVGEEGLGDLRGIRHLFTAGPHAGRIDRFFTLDGGNMRTLVTGAVGSYRYRVTFAGPGGHSFMNYGRVNPAFALGDFLAAMARELPPPGSGTTCSASVFGGGTSINALPEETWVEIDLRSTDPAALDALDARIKAAAQAAAEAENARQDTAAGPVTASFRQLGNRPAAPLLTSGPVIDESLAALRHFGIDPRLEASSTDANIPLSLGIPAVMIGAGHEAGGAHTLAEWVDVSPGPTATAASAVLAAILSVAGTAP